MRLISPVHGQRRKGAMAAALILAMTAATGRADDGGGSRDAAATTVERVNLPTASPGRVWREAEAFAASRVDCEVLFGRGDSMLPAFPDRTVIVVRRTPLTELRVGMTVVFFGDRGRMVAHTLVANSPGGWIAKGLANEEADRTRVRRGNYIGQVVRAYLPTGDGEAGDAGRSGTSAAEVSAGGAQ